MNSGGAGKLYPETGNKDPVSPVDPGGDGISYPIPTGKSSPSSPVYVVDYGGPKGLCISKDGAEPFMLKMSMPGFLRTRPLPLVLVTESTFCSYDPADRDEIFAAQDRGEISILLISPRKTARRRRELGLEKSDANDVRAMWDVYREGVYHLRRARRTVVSIDDQVRMFEVRLRQVQMRRSGYENEDAQRIRGWLQVGPYGVELGIPLSPFGYSVGLCAERAATRADFERMVGMYGHGYPSQVRSNAYWHRLKATTARSKNPSLFEPSARPPLKEGMVRLRRASRYVWAHRPGVDS